MGDIYFIVVTVRLHMCTVHGRSAECLHLTSFPLVPSSLVYSTQCFPTSRSTERSKGMGGGDGKLAEKNLFHMVTGL